VDPKTRTIQVQAEMSNPRRRLRPEMFGRIRHRHGQKSVAVVPPQAIVNGSNGSFVFVERSRGVFERVRVQPEAPIDGGAVPVLRNLNPGDRVVVNGAMLLLGMERH
jgi:multidrug efflux pump subunit AcrA (membrane-fusion protein)